MPDFCELILADTIPRKNNTEKSMEPSRKKNLLKNVTAANQLQSMVPAVIIQYRSWRFIHPHRLAWMVESIDFSCLVQLNGQPKTL